MPLLFGQDLTLYPIKYIAIACGRRLKTTAEYDHATLYITLCFHEYSEMTTIRAHRLTTFSVAADGASVSIGVADESGRPCALVLPSECLQALVMTLPEMASQSLRRRHRDPNLRLVFPVETWAVETSAEAERLIVTFSTADGFRASFALFADELVRMASTALNGDEAIAPPDDTPPPFLSH